MHAGYPVLNASQLKGRKARKERRKEKTTRRIALNRYGCLLVALRDQICR